MSSQFLAPVLRDGDEEVEQSLRPRRLDDFVGQERTKEQLDIALQAAKARGEALDHVLLVGPPGLGKTTLATIIREELDVGIRTVAGPALERKGDMAAILTSLDEKDVLFVDEIHRVNRAIEEILYPALEDFRLDIIVGQGAGARTLTLDLPPFTLVGATTRTGLLTTPLRDRFGMTFRLGYYEQHELATIVRRSAGILGVEIADEAADEVARRARGTPRVANRILRRIRDVAEVRHAGAVTIEIAQEALDLLEVDGAGLERVDRELLSSIAHKFGGGPVGLSTLAVSLGEETDTIEDVYEPYLLQLGFIQRTPQGPRHHRARSQAHRLCGDRGRALLTMSAHVWTPGAAGPLDEFVQRLTRMVMAFASEHELEQAEVCVELVDGSRYTLATTSAEPGFGFFSFIAHRDAGDEPRKLIVPIGAVRSIEISAPDPERTFGFVSSE